MIFGRNPWHEATPKDPVFSAYVGSDPLILKRSLKLNKAVDDFLRRKVFALEPSRRCKVEEFKRFVTTQTEFMETETGIASKLKIECKNEGAVLKFMHSSIDDSIESDFASVDGCAAESEEENDDPEYRHSVATEYSITSRVVNFGSSDQVHRANRVPTSSTMIAHIGSVSSIGRFIITSAKDLDNPYMDSSESRVQLAKKMGVNASSELKEPELPAKSTGKGYLNVTSKVEALSRISSASEPAINLLK